MKPRRHFSQRKSPRRKTTPDRNGDANPKILELVSLRVAQIHKCSASIEIHKENLKFLGETDRQIAELETWTTSKLFSGQDKVALNLCEEITLNREKSPSAASVQKMYQHFTKEAIISLTMAILAVNDWTYFDGSQPFLR